MATRQSCRGAGQLYESGPPLVPVLLALLLDDLSPAARSDVVELLLQLCYYGTHYTEVEAGNPHLEEISREHLRQGTFVLYRLLMDPDDIVRDTAVLLLGMADTDRTRLARVLAAVANQDSDPCLVRCARDLLDEIGQAE